MIVNPISKEIWEDRYRKNNETFDESLKRVAKYISQNEQEEKDFYSVMKDGYFYPAGRTMSNSGIGKTLTLNNCFTLNLVPDSMEGIFDYVKYGAITQKAGGGTGYNFSLLRPNGTPTSNDAVASGVVSFMNAFDSQTHTVLQGQRRGANLGCLLIYHPDIFDFLESKSWDEEKLTHFNLSVLVDDDFMKSVENNENIYLRYPCMNEKGEIIKDESQWKIKKEVNAKELWDAIIRKAYDTGEYGVLYYDNMNRNNNLHYMENIVTTNPCFTGDMRLLTKDGYKTLEELCDTEPFIYSYDGEITKGKVWCNGEKDTIKLKLSNNKEITCTPDHRFMTIDGDECKAKNLKNKKIMPKIYKTINDDELYIKLGFIQGDGQLSRLNSKYHYGIEVNIGEKDGDIRCLFEQDKYTEKSYRAIYLQGYNDLLNKLQFSQEILPNRVFPKTYNVWTLSQKSNFLQGCFSANGCVNSNKRISYKTTSKEFALELMNTLEKDFGITSNLTINKKHKTEFKNGEYECRESYDVNINKYNDILLFAQFIGFYQTYKKIKLNKLIESRVPYVRSIEENGKELVYDFTEPKNHWGIIEGCVAHNCAEYISGILYDEEGIKKEYMGACNLGSLFLHNFVIDPFTKNARMDFDKLKSVIKIAVRMLDNIIDINNYPLKQFENYQKNIRTIGLGLTGLADTFVMLNMKYGDEESVKFTDDLMNFITYNAYDTSCELAKEKGCFNFLNKEKFVESEFIKKHIDKYPEWKKIKDKILFYGIRNGRCISIAPAGTLSLSYGNNCSSSLEPIFALEYDRQIKMGGQDEENIEVFKMRDYAYEQWLNFKSEDNIVDESKFATAMELSVDDHVNILSTVSYHVDMSCSKTINIPTEYSFEDTKNVYTKCWKKGVSGCTIFRPNEIRQGILNTGNKIENKENLARGEFEKRPDSIIEIRRKIKSGCGSMTLHIGILPLEKRIFDFYVTNSSKGGCALGIQNLAIAMSHDLRIGGNLKSLEKSFKGAGTCPSYVRARGKNIEVSKGNSCGTSILYCLLDVENDLQNETLKELSELNYYTHNKVKEIEKHELTQEELDYIKENGETAFASKYHKCPECGDKLDIVGSCLQCKCGYSKC